jgi:uncharacterized damage-inducible protein DinB
VRRNISARADSYDVGSVFISSSASMSTSPIQIAISANILVIQQGVALLAGLGSKRYASRVGLAYNASIGGHLRHIIEHYQAFLRGLEEGDIDYENRVRDPLVENDPVYAGGLLESLVQRFEELAVTLRNGNLYYCVETTEGIATPTSMLRELEFLLSHTIHHYALVAVMARLQGHEPEPTFGVAPSTLKYQHAQALCAR